jgi:hypothetical protein
VTAAGVSALLGSLCRQMTLVHAAHCYMAAGAKSGLESHLHDLYAEDPSPSGLQGAQLPPRRRAPAASPSKARAVSTERRSRTGTDRRGRADVGGGSRRQGASIAEVAGGGAGLCRLLRRRPGLFWKSPRFGSRLIAAIRFKGYFVKLLMYYL